jgi:hypothetical protein
MTAIVTAIIAIAKAIPAIASLLNTIMSEWQSYQISQIEDNYQERQARRKFLANQLRLAKNDQERITAFKLLTDLVD